MCRQFWKAVPPICGRNLAVWTAGPSRWGCDSARSTVHLRLPGGHLLRETRISSWSAPVAWTATARERPILRFFRASDWNRFQDPHTIVSLKRRSRSRSIPIAWERGWKELFSGGRKRATWYRKRSFLARFRFRPIRSQSCCWRLPDDWWLSENRPCYRCGFAVSSATAARRSIGIPRGCAGRRAPVSFST